MTIMCTPQELRDLLDGASPNIMTQVVTPSVWTPKADDPGVLQTPGNADATPRHTWETKNSKPHPPRGED